MATYAIIYPSAKVYITMEFHHVYWENPVFVWPCSKAMLVMFNSYDSSPKTDRVGWATVRY